MDSLNWVAVWFHPFPAKISDFVGMDTFRTGRGARERASAYASEDPSLLIYYLQLVKL